MRLPVPQLCVTVLSRGNGTEVNGVTGVEEDIVFQVDTRESSCCSIVRSSDVADVSRELGDVV